MKWLVLIAFVALAKSEDYDCPAGKSSKTITIGEGDSFEFNSNPNGAEDYKNKQKCTVKYKKATSCNEMKFECQSFNVQNNAQNCKKGDKLFIGKNVFCQTQAVSETTTKKVLKVRFISNKKKTESGAQCTISCIDPEPPVSTEAPSSPSTTEAIIVAGGKPDTTSVEALTQDGQNLCLLPSLPTQHGRFGHTMDGNIMCGGMSTNYQASKNCIFFKEGSWENPIDLNYARFHHVSWGRSDPPMNVEQSHLFGGDKKVNGGPGDPFSSEVSGSAKGSASNYSLSHQVRNACSIQLRDYVVITGGYQSKAVYKYNDIGFVAALPSMNSNRAFHGCGYYYNNNDQLVYLVTGGIISNGLKHDTTEISIDEGSWNVVPSGNLPRPAHAMRGISFDNKLFMIGGAEGPSTYDPIADVLQWDITAKKWNFITNLKHPRIFGSVSLLPIENVQPYCQNVD